MKSILLIRHAKSSWDSLGQLDYDRPLNDRGLRDAPMMAERLHQKKTHLDALVSSTANRAFSTARFFARQLGFQEKDIKGIQKLYHAPPDVFREVIAALPEDWNRVAIFAHNPGITSFANEMGVARIDNMPTCGIFGVHAMAEKWTDFDSAEKRFWMFDYPKNF